MEETTIFDYSIDQKSCTIMQIAILYTIVLTIIIE